MSDIKEEQKRLYKRAEENDIKLLREENKRLNNIIDGMEKFFKYEFDNEVKPLNSYKVSVWTICLDKLNELKGDNK